MKVIFSRVKVPYMDIIQDRTALLVWFLSVLKWKQLGFETVFYTDEETKNELSEVGLVDLYDEVHILNQENIKDDVFWAHAKILSAKDFVTNYPDEEFIISDMDFIPLKNPCNFYKGGKELVVFYREYKQMYTAIENLKLNDDYQFPKYFTGDVDPINACQLLVHKEMLPDFKEYLNYELEFMNHYKNDFVSGKISNDIMIFLEQRLFTEFLVNEKGYTVVETSPQYKSVFNTSGLHTGPYKSLELAEYYKWIIWYLKMLREEFTDVYESIIHLDLYDDFRQIIEDGKGTHTNKKKKETYIEEFSWDTLEYPRAFEDIYDPVWNK